MHLGRLTSQEPQIALPHLRAPNRLGAHYGLRDVIAVAAATYDFNLRGGLMAPNAQRTFPFPQIPAVGMDPS